MCLPCTCLAGLPQALVVLPDGGGALAAAVQQCASDGDYGSLAMHVAASCLVAPLWEEVRCVVRVCVYKGVGGWEGGWGKGQEVCEGRSTLRCTVLAFSACKPPPQPHSMHATCCHHTLPSVSGPPLSIPSSMPCPPPIAFGLSITASPWPCPHARHGPILPPPPTPCRVPRPAGRQTFWRGFFLASMTKVLPLPACVAASSGLFAALHLGPGNLLPIMLLSSACDVLYLRTASLAAPLAFHAGYNLYELAGVVLLHKESFV